MAGSRSGRASGLSQPCDERWSGTAAVDHGQQPAQCPHTSSSPHLPNGLFEDERSQRAGNRVGRRPPLPPEQPVHRRVRDVAVHDAVFLQMFLHARNRASPGRGPMLRCVYWSRPGPDSGPACRMPIEARRARPPSRSRYRCRLLKAVAKRRAAVVRVPLGETAPADERPVGNPVRRPAGSRYLPLPSVGKPR